MKKLLAIIIIIISLLILILVFDISQEEKEYYQDFIDLDTEDLTLFIDGNYHYFIYNLDVENDQSQRINSDWMRVLDQNEDLKSLYMNKDNNQYISIDYTTLVNDINSNLTEEVSSFVTLNYKNGVRRYSKDIEVLFYDFNRVDKFITSDYWVDIYYDGYEFIADDGDKRHYYFITYDAFLMFSTTEETITLAEKYLGYDIEIIKDDETVTRVHLHNVTKYNDKIHKTNLGYYDESIRFYKNQIIADISKSDASNIAFEGKVDGVDEVLQYTLSLNEEITINDFDVMDITVTLLEQDLVEIRYESSLYIYTYIIRVR